MLFYLSYSRGRSSGMGYQFRRIQLINVTPIKSKIIINIIIITVKSTKTNTSK